MKYLKKASTVFIGVIIVSAVVYTGLSFYSTNTVVFDKETLKEEILFGDSKKLEEIRGREDIKRQQELIVQEIYLVEERARIEIEIEEAMNKFDTELDAVESKLEIVRDEKLSF